MVDPGLAVAFARHDGDRIAAGDVVATRRRLDALDRRRRAHGAQLPRPPLGHRHGDARARRRRARGRPRRRRPRHAQDDARGCAPSRRPPCAPAAGRTTARRCPRRCCSRTTTSASLAITEAVARARAGVAGRARRRWSATREAQVDEAVARAPTPCCSTTWTPSAPPTCVAAVRRTRRDVFVEASGRITARDRAALRGGGRRRGQQRRADAQRDAPSTSDSTSSRDDVLMLLAIDVGNTETVVGLYELDGGARPRRPTAGLGAATARLDARAGLPLAALDGRGAHARRARRRAHPAARPRGARHRRPR